MGSGDPSATPSIADVIDAMQARLDSMPPHRTSQAEFLSTYRRTTEAVAAAVAASAFEDPA